MDGKFWSIFLILIIPAATALWKTSQEQKRTGYRRDVHYHTKRHMLAAVPAEEQKLRRRSSFQRPKDIRREKPSGHLKPLDEDDIDNDEVISVAVGPPPTRSKYEKVYWKNAKKPIHYNTYNNTRNNNVTKAATNLVKDVLIELGREFLTRQVNENFIFGQYLGNAMKNLTNELRLKMQHDILDLILRYQKVNKGDFKVEDKTEVGKAVLPNLKEKEVKVEKRITANETDENWPDFTNLAKIVG